MGPKIREDLKSLLASLSPDTLSSEQRQLEAQALVPLTQSKFIARARTVALYAAVHGEVDVRFFERYLQSLGVKTVYPKVSEPDEHGARTLTFHAASFSELTPGAFGILEPSASAMHVPVSELSLAVFPGRAFGKSGERIGSGKGYYDRAFGAHLDIPRLAFSFQYQLFETLPQLEWDLSMDWMLSVGHEYRSRRILP